MIRENGFGNYLALFEIRKCVFPKCTFLGPQLSRGGAWYGIFSIREKPVLRAGLINSICTYTSYIFLGTVFLDIIHMVYQK